MNIPYTLYMYTFIFSLIRISEYNFTYEAYQKLRKAKMGMTNKDEEGDYFYTTGRFTGLNAIEEAEIENNLSLK